MNLDSRLSSVLHLLLHLMETRDPIPSDKLATALNSNPVVVRRTMTGLREVGIVSSEKGHGGGWRLTSDPAVTTVLDVYRALGSPRLFAVGNRCETPTCLVEQAVNAALNDAFQEAEALITAQLGTLTLATLATDFQHRLQPYLSEDQESTHVF
ncbi:Rrf2 family transcriptional regulator [Deinococcus gobiensis]|uniref:Transcriptional regulator n=1 Tax=Deinococcus gobiensis (strain DSM 21396 / JCM 16679 / CGMCC 1.7299 / I-0) TaxID=745776 RepID=H8H2W3_DEIGI|nr:Rrf2 family transcriptional regulator [Deinococcus gobiensis]AFD27860.1 transcriptional regulator [Deinococcus gobiensis I-0]